MNRMQNKLDAILARKDTPQIHEVVDCDKYPWVCKTNAIIATPFGTVSLVRAMLSGGSSGAKVYIPFLGIEIDLAKDVCTKAHNAHDELFKNPYVSIDGLRKRIGFFKCNKIYGWILKNHGYKAVGRFRRTILNLFSWPVWYRYRKQERNGTLDLTDWFVPHAQNWGFPTSRTRDARWIGVIQKGE